MEPIDVMIVLMVFMSVMLCMSLAGYSDSRVGIPVVSTPGQKGSRAHLLNFGHKLFCIKQIKIFKIDFYLL